MKRIFFSVVKLVFALLFIVSVTGTVRAADNMTVIVNKANMNTVNKSQVAKIYSGDMAAWTSGGSIAAFDLPEDSAERAAFTTGLLGKSVRVLKAQWAAKLFAGRATPPKVVGSDEEMKRAVAGNKNAIGYIRTSSLDDTVKSILTVD